MSEPRPEVDAAVFAVLRDLGLTDVTTTLHGEQVEISTPAGWVTIWHDDLSRGAAVVTHVADQLQNDVHMWLDGAWGEPLPRCPGHGHPLDAHVVDEQAWWVCPASSQPVARVGELRGQAARA